VRILDPSCQRYAHAEDAAATDADLSLARIRSLAETLAGRRFRPPPRTSTAKKTTPAPTTPAQQMRALIAARMASKHTEAAARIATAIDEAGTRLEPVAEKYGVTYRTVVRWIAALKDRGIDVWALAAELRRKAGRPPIRRRGRPPRRGAAAPPPVVGLPGRNDVEGAIRYAVARLDVGLYRPDEDGEILHMLQDDSAEYSRRLAVVWEERRRAGKPLPAPDGSFADLREHESGPRRG
jgi:hypothetical protein